MKSRNVEKLSLAGGTRAAGGRPASAYHQPMREFALLEHVFAMAGAPCGPVLIGPGDDMALVAVGERPILLAIDQVVAGCHFDLQRTPMALVGRKAVNRSLSDIAAMAGVPSACLAAVTLPRDLTETRARELFDAMDRTAREHGCPLVGGDIAIGRASADLVCSVAVVAEPGPAGAVSRAGARAGDRVYVTGELGGSLGPDRLGRHLTFEPRLEEALELARLLGSALHAMIDLSDGLGRDAGHLAERSGVQVQLDADRVPCAPGLDWRRALGDGEDYELCFTADGPVPRRLGGVAVTEVGRVAERRGPGEPLVLVREGDRTWDASGLGWEHAT